jgi:hypothetical protein
MHNETFYNNRTVTSGESKELRADGLRGTPNAKTVIYNSSFINNLSNLIDSPGNIIYVQDNADVEIYNSVISDIFNNPTFAEGDLGSTLTIDGVLQ